MSFLFKIENKIVFPNEETLLISPFKDIWDRDKTIKKENALKEFAYIEFISSLKSSNPYRQYPETKKEEIIIKDIIKNKNWKPDKLIKEGIEKIKEFQTKGSTTYLYYISVKRAAEHMQDFFNKVDINEKNEKTGNPVYKPSDLTRTLNDTEKVLSNLKALEKKVEEELYEETKTKSDKKISIFSDPNSLI